MKYWKDGFYDAPQGGAVEITEEYYTELLNGQSNGSCIVENEEGYPVLKKRVITLEEFKVKKIAEINAYDKSNAVNVFFIEGHAIWFDKETRSGLKLRFDAEKTNGQITTFLWSSGEKISLTIDVAIHMLMDIEMYAGKCYDTTQQHIATINGLISQEDVNCYDYKTAYPDKLTF